MDIKVGIKNLDKGTDIRDIEVPEELKDRWETGIRFFDQALGGEGFTPSTVALFTGSPGAGKTTLALQVADSLSRLYTPEDILFNTAEESLYQTRSVFDRLDLRGGFIVGQDTDIRKITQHADVVGASFLIVDSIQTLWDEEAIESGKRKSTTDIGVMKHLTEWAKDRFKIVLAIGQVNKDGVFKGKNEILHMVDLAMHLSVFQCNKGPKRIYDGCRELHVHKNRFGHSGHSIMLDMTRMGLILAAR